MRHSPNLQFPIFSFALPGREGGTPRKIGWACAAPPPKTLTPFKIKVSLIFSAIFMTFPKVLAGHSAAIVTDCVTRMTTTCSPMIGQFPDTMNGALTDKEWL